MGGGTCTSEGNYKMSEVITKQKILIADDSEMNRELLAAILEEEYDIIQVNDGVQAVDEPLSNTAVTALFNAS